MKDHIREEQDACNYLRNELGYSWKEISDELGIPERRVKQRLYEFYRREQQSEEFTDSVAETSGLKYGAYHFSDGREVATLDKFDWSKILVDKASDETKLVLPSETKVFKKDESLFGHMATDKRRENIAKMIEEKHNKKNVKILNLSDLHVPFTDWNNVYKVVKAHRDADILQINGDLLDLFAVSKYAKDKMVAVRQEMDEAREFLEEMSSIFKDIVITDGNHERRLGNMIKNLVPVEAQFLFPSDILKVLVNGSVLDKKPISNVHVVGSFWVKLWDVVFAHPDNFSGTQLKTVIDVSQKFLLNHNIQHRMCIIGHTHQAGWIVDNGIKKMETGCLCFDMDYHHGSKMTKHDWTKAHAVVQINNGEVDFNESTVHLL